MSLPRYLTQLIRMLLFSAFFLDLMGLIIRVFISITVPCSPRQRLSLIFRLKAQFHEKELSQLLLEILADSFLHNSVCDISMTNEGKTAVELEPFNLGCRPHMLMSATSFLTITCVVAPYWLPGPRASLRSYEFRNKY